MNRRIKKWVFRPLLIIGIIVLATAGTAYLILATQQKRLVDIAVSELNKQLKGEITVGESRISLFKNFPYVSIGLHDVLFFSDKTKSGKPVYKFDRLYAGFSLPDIFQQRYDIRRLIVNGGHIELIRRADGTLNLPDTNDTPSTTTPVDTLSKDSTQFGEINLQKMVIKNVEFSFLDEPSGRTFHSQIEKLTSTFRIDSSAFTLSLTSEMELDVTTKSDTSFFRHKRFKFDIDADYIKGTKHFQILSCNFRLEKAAFSVKGSADLSGPNSVNFKVKGEKQDFNLLSAFVPDDVKEKLKPFRYDGRLYFEGAVKGNIDEDRLPLIEISFGCEDAWFLNTGADRKVDQLGFKGFYTNGSEHNLRTSELHLINISARPEKGVFNGNFVIRDFTKPLTLVQIKSELELKFLGEFLGIADLKQITGKIKLDMNFKELKDIHLPEQSLNKLKEGIQSTLSVENLTFRIPGYPHAVRDMDMHAEMKDGRITLDSALLRIGKSNIRLSGSLSDVRAFLREHHKPISLKLNASSDHIILHELFAYDTALARKMNEEIHGFNIGLLLETTVDQLLHPSPLPKGKLEIKNLRASFKKYPHAFRDMSALVMVDDTLARLRNFTGMIDKSDIQFSGRVINYQLWFNKIKKGKTQIAFDFKSKRFAMEDVLGPTIRKYIPRGYRREELSDVWVRTKIDLRYDTTFRFAKARIANVTGVLKKHQLTLTEISGGLKYGARVLILDTLRGKIGRSDFDISLKYFNGPDRNMKKRTNSLQFTSKFLDADEISQYDLAPAKGRRRAKADSLALAAKPDSSHAQAFNIFMIPFSDFNMQVDIGKLKYSRLWMKDITARVRMLEDHHLYIDTLRMKIADGTVAMRGHLNGTNPEKIYFRSRINVEQVDLGKMLIKLDHFGQDVVVNKNVKGRLSGQIRSYVQIHPDFVPIMSKTKAELNIRIFNGTLVDFAPMQAMSSYFKDKNLRLIRFDTLQNKLSFTNGVLDIPSMNINSSLGYIQMSGKQSLDLNMEYYIRVPMKMVTKVGFGALFSRKPEEVDLTQVDEIEYIDKDRKVAFMNLKVTGKPEDFKVGLGRNKAPK